MTNLNKTYHKGKYRGGEWAKHLRPYLKRLGNKRFRKSAVSLEQSEFERYSRTKKNRINRKTIRAKITISLFGNSTYSYYKSYRRKRDLENAVARPNVVRYILIDMKSDSNK